MSRINKAVSQLSGELATIDVQVPFSPGFSLDALREVDPDPVFATVKVKPGKGDGGKGPNYSPELLKNLEAQFNDKRPSGYRGHQDPDKVSFEWREPVTAWVGARFDDAEQVLYVKGYVPPTAPELRSQLALARSGADVVNSVSIFGMRQTKGEEVTAFDVWSLDWTPKGRAGMETELVSVSGEMEDGDSDVTREEVLASLTAAEVPEAIRAQILSEHEDTLEPAQTAVGEMRIILELSDEDPAAVVEAVRNLVDADRTAELETRVSSAVTEEVSGELMQTAITERLLSRLPVDASDEDIAGEIATARELPHIKALGGSKVPVIVGGGGSDDSTDERKGTQWQ
jgi:hypothetical protein